MADQVVVPGSKPKQSSGSPDDFGMAPDDTMVIVPNLYNLDPSKAVEALEVQRLGVNLINQPTPGVLTPRVLYTDPPPGTEVERGHIITVLVSTPEAPEQETDGQDGDGEYGQDGESENQAGAGNQTAEKVQEAKNRYDAIRNAERLAKMTETTGAMQAGAVVVEGEAVGEAVAVGVSLWPLWAALAGLAAIIILIVGIIMITMTYCNNSNLVKWGSWAYGFFGGTDACKALSLGDVTSEVPPNPESPTPAGPLDLVALQGVVLVDPGTSDARVRSCMLDDVVAIFDAAKAAGLDVVVTSAYRPGSKTSRTGGLSAHGRGEALDIALRNPSVSIHSTDPRIAQLVGIARGIFRRPASDVVDEYTFPEDNTTGGHVHVEFNLRPDGSSYCNLTATTT